MIWVSENSRYKKQRIARRNIKTFILVNVDGNTIKPVKYNNNVTFEINKQVISDIVFDRSSRKSLVAVEGLVSHKVNPKFVTVEMLDVLEKPQHNQNMKALICFIPKGTKYYLNEIGSYVSTSLIPVKLTEAIKTKI